MTLHIGRQQLRPASQVMSPQWLAAAYPSALSFSRMAMRQFVHQRWRLERQRLDLDSEGRGRALYILSGGGYTFHFLVLSNILPENQLNDRNFAAAWDVTAALCEGPWSSEREEMLARQVPKQERGRVDHDTLIMVRANRSARLYNHVIDSLSEGHQPSADLLSEVGYIMRTTAFLGNGQSGTRPFWGFPSSHPLSRSHYAQIAAAFALREFVYDLVDHVAATRSKFAVRLADSYRRYLGLGNSSAAGLIRFLYNHPCLLHGWMENWEGALAAAKARPLRIGSQELQSLLQLLKKAQTFFEQTGRAPRGVFMPAEKIAVELEAIFAKVVDMRDTAGESRELSCEALCEWVSANAHPESVEVFNSILIELYPDIIETYLDRFNIDETVTCDLSMTVARLIEIIEQRYDWVLEAQTRERIDDSFFWFHSVQAPADARRGYRYVVSEVEYDSAFDTIRNVLRLRAVLDDFDLETPIGEMVMRHPDLRMTIARVQSMAGRQYGELRENPLGRAYSPFPPLRRILAFYGVEKFESVDPKIVRGVLLQGAPIASDVAQGRDGTWPFPLQPAGESGYCNTWDVYRPLPTLVEGGADTPSDVVVVAEPEIVRLVQRALQAAGVDLGTSKEIAQVVANAELVAAKGVESLLHQLHAFRADAPAYPSFEKQGSLYVWNSEGAAALWSAMRAFDQAISVSIGRRHGEVAVVVNGCVGDALLDQFVLRAVGQGLSGFGLHIAGGPLIQLTFANPGTMPWIVRGATGDFAKLATWLSFLIPNASGARKYASEFLQNLQIQDGNPKTETFLLVLSMPTEEGNVIPRWRACESLSVSTLADLNSKRLAALRRGIKLSCETWESLNMAAAKILISPNIEARLREPGFDPAKQF